jgi:hypothetical protein
MELPMAEKNSNPISTVTRALADNRIVVVVEGGVVQDVFGVPKGYGLEVHDYDVEGCNESDLDTNDDGDKFFRGVWQEPDTAKEAPAVQGELLKICEEAQSVCEEAADWISGDEAYDIDLVSESLTKMAEDLGAAIDKAKGRGA